MHALREGFARILRDALTDASNSTYEMFRISAALGVTAFILYSGYALVVFAQWEPIEYGTGLGAVLAGTGAALRLKGEDPPKEAKEVRDVSSDDRPLAAR